MKRLSLVPYRASLRCAAVCAVTAGLIACAPLTAWASDASAVEGWSAALAASKATGYSAYNSEGATSAATKTFPSALDLSALGVVTPPKNQGESNTCWAHAAITASETSILSELGTTYAATGLDLSERHLSWFAYSTSTEAYAGAAQAGEGFLADPNAGLSSVLKNGGYQTYVSTLFSAGIGPVLESTAPFKSDAGVVRCVVYDEGTTEPIPGYKVPSTYYLTLDQIAEKKLEWEAKGFQYTVDEAYAISGFNLPDPGWGLDNSLYGQSVYTLEQSYLLPDVRELDSDGNYAGANEEAIAAIKEQLNAGRGVAAVIYYNTSAYLNQETGAYYNNTTGGSAHAVAIVGYDDDYAPSNFKDGAQPSASGAFLCKNSVGASTNEFPNHGEFGIKDADGNYTGYFWLSYYDHTITTPAAYDFDLNSDTSDETFAIDQYNLMAPQTTLVRSSEAKVSSANVFEADSDRVLRAVSCETAKLNTQATYEIYLLDDDATSPTDGTLVLTKAETYEYGGYHRCLLDEDERLGLRAGQRYSVVVTLKAQVDGAEKYYQTVGKSSVCANSDYVYLRNGEFVAKVNEGESYTLEADGQWSDWTAVTSALAGQQTNCAVDNPPIKAFYQERDWASVDELTALREQIGSAQTLLAKVRVSADGTDVDPADVWVTQADYDALAAAIADAQATLALAGDFEAELSTSTPDSATVDAAIESVESAMDAFRPAAGTKGPSGEKEASNTSRAAAASGSDLPQAGDERVPASWLTLASLCGLLLAVLGYRGVWTRE